MLCRDRLLSIFPLQGESDFFDQKNTENRPIPTAPVCSGAVGRSAVVVSQIRWLILRRKARNVSEKAFWNRILAFAQKQTELFSHLCIFFGSFLEKEFFFCEIGKKVGKSLYKSGDLWYYIRYECIFLHSEIIVKEICAHESKSISYRNPGVSVDPLPHIVRRERGCVQGICR